MPVIDADTIRRLVTVDGRLFVPEKITKAIGQTVVSDVTDISNEIDRLAALYKQYEERDEPTPVDYSSELTIDAYAIHYLPRSTLIPKLLFLSLAYHPAFQTIKDEVNILDLGSGTGGVVLGLLDLFKAQPFLSIKANIMSCERSQVALDRQIEILKCDEYQHFNVWHLPNNVADENIYDKGLLKLAPYDYIFAVNLFAELSLEDIKLILSRLQSIMAPNAVLLIADPPRTYVDGLQILISENLRSSGLFQYYPCPPGYKCPKTKCQWVWLSFDFICPDIQLNSGSLETNRRLTTTWSIFCHSEHSIYDVLQKEGDGLTWGTAVPIGDEFSLTERLPYSMCTASGPYPIIHTRNKALLRNKAEVIHRGSVLGINSDFSKTYSWHPLYGLKQ